MPRPRVYESNAERQRAYRQRTTKRSLSGSGADLAPASVKKSKGSRGSPKRGSRSWVSIHFSHATDEWETPQWLFDVLDAEFHFTRDPCASDENHKCARYYTTETNGLAQSWAGEVVWMNPPYSDLATWMQKAHDETERGATVVCLVPARTETRWWHNQVLKAQAVRFLKGRLKFSNSQHNAPFGCAVVVFRSQLTWVEPTISFVDYKKAA